MCGICGIVGPHERRDLERMVDAQHHRGPDDRTVMAFDGCTFGFNRLSIIDVSGGRQPIADESGRRWIIFNGEIYNFPELRTELEGLGHRFSTHTDTETVLHGYEVWGFQVVDHLRGMFAFAIWDEQEKSLFLARDRLGIKPLYYAKLGQTLAFSSELKALATLPSFPRALDLVAIAQYLGGRYALTTRSPFEGARRLPPGHFAIVKDGQIKIERYWQYAMGDGGTSDEVGLSTSIHFHLQDTVRRMLVSEVPVGFFLSGGLDSSAVLALAAPMMEGAPLTFTSTYDVGDPSISEGRFASLMAEEVGSQHEEVLVRAQDIPSRFPQFVWSLDEPLIDPASYSEYLLSLRAKRRATVILVGEGSDEQFGGYANKWRLLRIQQRLRQAGVGGLARLVPPPSRFKVGKFARGLSLLHDIEDREQFYFDSGALLSQPELRSVLPAGGFAAAADQYYQERSALFQSCTNGDTAVLNPFLVYDARYALPANILLKVDRTTMAASIEARVPFLDEAMIDMAQRIPPGLKYRDGIEKYALRKAVSPYLPGVIAWRPKQAFRTPIGEWCQELKPMAEKLLMSGDSMLRDFVLPSTTRDVLAKAGPKSRYAAHQLWSFLTLEVWLREYLRGESPSAIVGR